MKYFSRSGKHAVLAKLPALRALTSALNVQARAASVGRVLYGYYHVPDRSSKPIDFIINPEGMELRSRKRCGRAAGSVTKHVAACQATYGEYVRLYIILHALRAVHLAVEQFEYRQCLKQLIKASQGH